MGDATGLAASGPAGSAGLTAENLGAGVVAAQADNARAHAAADALRRCRGVSRLSLKSPSDERDSVMGSISQLIQGSSL